MADGYDIIGDIHGHADALKQLLKKLGYHNTNGAYRNSGRKAIFLGDLIDRGTQNRETIKIVRGMIESESALAIMGNHEYNAICFHTEHPENSGNHLRPWSKKNVNQHIQFLCEFKDKKDELKETINWFKTLPLFLELEGFRVVHACWHDEQLKAFKKELPDGKVTLEFLVKSSDKSNKREYRWIENILKGPECELPDDKVFLDKDEHPRKEVRMQWWLDNHTSFRDAAWADENILKLINPDENVCQDSMPGYNPGEPPVFFGHYWLTGDPKLMASNVACLDYSVGKGGKLCAYRWDGEKQLDASRLVLV